MRAKTREEQAQRWALSMCQFWAEGAAYFGADATRSLVSLECHPDERSTMAKKKIDPLNKKQYGAVSAMLTVSDIPAAVSFYQKAFGFTKRGIMNGPDGKAIHAELTLRGTTFYQKAFGFTKRGIMNGPDGKAIHAELTLRGTTLMLGPENAS